MSCRFVSSPSSFVSQTTGHSFKSFDRDREHQRSFDRSEKSVFPARVPRFSDATEKKDTTARRQSFKKKNTKIEMEMNENINRIGGERERDAHHCRRHSLSNGGDVSTILCRNMTGKISAKTGKKIKKRDLTSMKAIHAKRERG